jgi:hypothetical protein
MALDLANVLLIAQVGSEVISLGRAAIGDVIGFLHSTGADKEKIAELRTLYAAAIAAEQAEVDAPLEPATA